MKRKILQALVDRLVLKTMSNQSSKAQKSGGEAAFPTR
jgi:hypothetical protein